ncbi:MAG: hypothetical protein AAGH60_09990 [Pseudomonadota bacterium]
MGWHHKTTPGSKLASALATTALGACLLSAPAYAGDAERAAHRLAQLFNLDQPVSAPSQARSGGIGLSGAAPIGVGNTIPAEPTNAAAGRFEIPAPVSGTDGFFRESDDATAFQAAPFYTLSASLGLTSFDVERTWLVTENTPGILSAAFRDDIEVEGTKAEIDGHYCFGQGETLYPYGPTCLGVSLGFVSADGEASTPDTFFPNGVGLPGVGVTPGAYTRSGGTLLDADVFNTSYDVDYEAWLADVKKIFLSEQVGTNGIFDFGVDFRFAHQSTEDLLTGSVAVPGVTTDLISFLYDTEVDVDSYGASLTGRYTHGVTFSDLLLIFVSVNAALGIQYSSLDGTDRHMRMGVFGTDYDQTNDLEDSQWSPTAEVGFTAGIALDTGLIASVFGEASWNELPQYTIDRPDSDATGALPSSATFNDGFESGDSTAWSVGVRLSYAIPAR